MSGRDFEKAARQYRALKREIVQWAPQRAKQIAEEYRKLLTQRAERAEASGLGHASKVGQPGVGTCFSKCIGPLNWEAGLMWKSDDSTMFGSQKPDLGARLTQRAKPNGSGALFKKRDDDAKSFTENDRVLTLRAYRYVNAAFDAWQAKWSADALRVVGQLNERAMR